jgi:uncharacterized protein YndB with AHSA1/START domain
MKCMASRIMAVRILLAATMTAAAMLNSARAGEHTWRDFPHVTNTAYVEANGDRAIQLSIDVPAAPHAVFAAFSTSEGFSSWAVPVTKVDFRIGGSMESSYDASAKIGDPNNIRNQILAYVPDRLLVIRNVQTPAGFPTPELFQRTVTIIEFTPVGDAQTRVRITNAGYGKDKGFDVLYRNFEWGDAYSLAELRSRFEKGPVDWQARAAKERAEAATKAVEKPR